ncbi:MAG: hypothetical protein FWC39_08820 [Bacteroidetes bacterium]|nr:hypothetical protein [Bacteroidota bacterium]
MTISNWIAIISVSAVILGWFINSYLARRNNTVNTRIKYRVETLKKVLGIYLFIQKNSVPLKKSEFIPMLEMARGDLQLFGKKKEVFLMEKFIKSIERNDVSETNKYLYKLVELSFNNLRKELRLKNIKINI